jgi:glycogen phosphorylase
MKAYRTYDVEPRLPESLEGLRRVAYNLWWCWNTDAIELLRRIDRDLWDVCGHNPVVVLGRVGQERWERLADDESFRQHLERVLQSLREYEGAETWFRRTYPQAGDSQVAYFSLEYGLSECLPIYAGGLGVLAGDHLKSASDTGVPLVGVGLLYQVGYFAQYLNADGWQQEEYTENDFHQLPVEPVKDASGRQMALQIPTDDHQLTALVWRVNVGRVPLYLLDTNTEANTADDRGITHQLYSSGSETRIRQEVLLGIGGIQALESLGLRPTVYHMNEGHAAFLGLERVRRTMLEQKLSFAEAVEATRVGNVFTTHTPVPAGHDRFPAALMEKYFKHYWAQLGLSQDQFMGLGRQNPADGAEEFCMTTLALKLSAWRNGVSKLHGEVSRGMWKALWPQVSAEEVPITSVTNGIHVGTFISNDMAVLYDRYLGQEWRTEPGNEALWARVATIPDAELWRAHERRRERLVAVARVSMRRQLAQRGAGPADLAQAAQVLDPEALTLGFGRRFATYKRATLILRHPDRLKALLTNRERPVQLIFAGKAHPADGPGKELIRDVVRFARDPELRHRIVFLENYDLNLARYIVQGVDVWLNTPLRPLEASGTSGMKVTANGGLNCSVLDGWWVEAYTPDTGWAIGRGEEYADINEQNEIEADALYTLLEQEIVPLFYDRGPDGVPARWVSKMKTAMGAVCPEFNAHRMVREYAERFYLPGMRRGAELATEGYGRARELAAWVQQLRQGWPEVRFLELRDDAPEVASYGDRVTVRARVALGALQPSDVVAQLHAGGVSASGELISPQAHRMEYVGPASDDGHLFVGTVDCTATGRLGYTVRLLPSHRDLVSPFDVGSILWA